MFDFEEILLLIDSKYETVEQRLETQLSRIQTGAANPQLIRKINILYYDEMTPLDNLAVISSPEAHQLLVKPFDRTSAKDIEKTLCKSGLDITVVNEGDRLRLSFPILTNDRRKILAKNVLKIQEETKVAIRSIRQEANRAIKKAKDEIGEDNTHKYLEEVQQEVDKLIAKIEKIIKGKTDELFVI